MDPAPPPPPPPPVGERCYRHPMVATGVHCTRCGRPICPDCMQPAPVGYQCPECARGNRQKVVRPANRIGTGPPRGFSLTNTLLAILVGIFAIEVAVGGSGTLVGGPSPRQLFEMGGAFSPAIAAGQYWRMFTSMFLHIGVFHILMNGYALYLFGNVVEAEQGKTRFLAAYLVTGLAASAASYAFGPVVAVGAGASGAIFGLFGMFLGQAYRNRNLAFYQARVRSAMSLILLNAIIAFSIPGIDWRAHAGGLVAGTVIGFAGEGTGKTGSRTTAFLIALGAVAVATVALTLWRTAALTGG